MNDTILKYNMEIASKNMRVYIKTLGCKVNAFDSHAISFQLKTSGFLLCDEARDAGVIIINSCSVTSRAEKEALYYARKFRRATPDCFIVITGCYAQTASDFLQRYPEIDYVIPNAQKPQLLTLLQQRLQANDTSKMPADSIAVRENKQGHFKLAQTLTSLTHSTATRKYVKVQDGCNGFCSYCIIPYARGASTSVSPDQVLAQIATLTAQGANEIILTGVHLGDYGMDLATKTSFPALLREIFALPSLCRLRISSLEPSELSDELLSVLHANRQKFCPHFHLPLQSGSDRILRLMRRKYRAGEYLQRLRATQSLFPDAMYGADVICGFPSETAEEQDITERYVQAVGLNYLHVFPYSKRPNTSALRLAGHLPPATIKARHERLQNISQKLKRAYYQRFLNKKVQVLWEKELTGQKLMTGYSRNYLRVHAPYVPELLQTESSVVFRHSAL